MDKRVFPGCAQVFIGALYTLHGETSSNEIGRSMDWGLMRVTNKKTKFSNNNHDPVVANSVRLINQLILVKSFASTVEVFSSKTNIRYVEYPSSNYR